MTGVALCLILEAGFLAAGEGGHLNPEAVSVAGTVLRLAQELHANPAGAELTLVLEEDGSDAAQALRAVADRDLIGVPAPAGAQACPPGSRPLLLSLRLVAGDLRNWVMGDARTGLEDVSDADRKLREELGVPVPRRMAPDHITGELLRMPPSTSIDTLHRAVFEADQTSWANLAGAVVLYTENSDQADGLRADGAQVLSRAVHLTRLRLLRDPPTDAVPLLTVPGMVLAEVPATETSGLNWRDLRFATLR
ncbi:hypothetical protein [Puniceibacterium confluentis]|uniref:hypothetical protein n=1 Tax=Puniceibacterium confluentis TaxID=1958944 RepID=UPI0011B78349|nr:hypothetical protein [Puniceibacterium confluentis]